MVKPIVVAAGLLMTLAVSYCPAATTDGAAAERADKLKKLYRREARAENIVPAVEAILKIDAGKGEAVKRRADFLEQVINEAGTTSEERLNDDVDILEKMTKTASAFTSEDQKQLQEQYAKVAALLDDQIFIKDLENALIAHDKLIKNSNLANYNKAKIQDELKHIEQLVTDAPPIPYGRSELLRNLQSKKLLPPGKGAYLGIHSNDPAKEQIFLSTARRSVGDIDELGSPVQLDSGTVNAKASDGSLIDLNAANQDNASMFSPPISLWMKERLLEGHIPVIHFNGMTVQDAVDGKYDEYLQKNLQIIADTKAPVLIDLLPAFDRLAATAFGADGRTPYYMLVDPKLAKLPADKLVPQLEQRLAKAGFVKDTGVELRKYYGDPTIPDGPERTRDAWKRLQKVAANFPTISLIAITGTDHGFKKGLGGDPYAGAQDWNKLQYYWPGEGVLQWVGTAERVADPTPPAGTLAAMEPFVAEVNSSNFQSLPMFLHDYGPAVPLSPAQESAWISACVQDIVQLKHPQVKAVFIAYPEAVTLDSSDAHGALRRAVGSNPYFKQKLRLKDIE
jgi:hypothetical protein